MQSEFVRFLKRQTRWALETFGEGPHTAGIIDHIKKELKEIEANPFDLEEWIDVAILAINGYMRHGGQAVNFLSDLNAKHWKNVARKWPIPQPGDLAIEHIREKNEWSKP